jgi:hypothetical protein
VLLGDDPPDRETGVDGCAFRMAAASGTETKSSSGPIAVAVPFLAYVSRDMHRS